MRSMTFQVDDQSTGSAIPAVVVTITENEDGSLSFTINVVGTYTGDLRGFFFDLADESHLGTLTATATSGLTEFQQGNDSVVDLGNGANMQGLVGSDGGYDAGLEIGTAGTGRDDYQSFSFRLASTAGALTLDDFANVDFGVRLTSVGELGSRDGEAKLLEHTTSAIDAVNDANAITEDAAPNTVSGNVFANDLNLGASHSVTNPGIVQGTYGALQLNADGSYTYTLNNAAVQFLAVGETWTETFAYAATASDEATSSSSDSAVLGITIVGTNDAPQITAAVAAGSVLEFAEDSPLETLGSHFVGGTADFEDVDLSDVHSVSVTPAPATYLGRLSAQVTDDSTGDGEGQVSWTYEVSDAAVEHLGLGDSLTQTYTIAVDDGHGGSDTQDVTITINGANDAPEIVAGNTNGDVFEDGSRSASGQLVALDIDQGSALSWSVTGSGPMTPRGDYRFLIDNLNIIRSGVPFFNDDFGNGAPPPAGTTFGYFTFGTFLESGGRVIMDGSLGAASTISGVTAISQLATLNTGDVNQGLTRDQNFKVEARYDLVMPADVLGTYGLRLADGANDIVEIDVRRLPEGSVAVVLREANVPGTVPVTLAAIPLAPAPGDNQIVLRLEHAANTDLISASFDLLNGGVVTQTQAFALAPDIFSDENWTRVQFNALTPATLQNGVYGTLSVEADGQWSYALNNRAANVQALAQGEHVTDVFTVRVTDEHGASDAQTVTVDVFGSNDAPIITAGDVNGFVQEDGFLTTVTRQFTATDVDHLPDLHWSVGPQTQVPVPGVPNSFSVFGYSSSYRVTVDELKVVRNGATTFQDDFDPSAPSFPNGPGNNYLTNFAGFGEDGGRLVLDGSRANSVRGIGSAELVAGHIAVLNTNADSADLTRGLKSDDDFTVEARFDLVTPAVGQGYGLSLTDNTTNGLPPDQLGDDNVNLFVRADAAGNLSVQFSRFDIPADTVSVYQSLAFMPAAGENQIVLRLTHDADHRGIVHAEFDLLGGAGGARTLSFTETAHLFGTSTPGYAGDDEEWTRAQVVAFGLDPYDADSDPTTHQGTYGSLSVQQNGEWTYALDNGSANVQALAQFQFAQDLFSIRVVDEYGMSSFRPAFISVQGSNDPVTAAGGDTSGAVSEDTAPAASGTLAFTDVDLIDMHTAFFAPGGVFGTFMLDPMVAESPLTPDVSVGWRYQLNNDTVQFLAEGETWSESFFVTAQDQWGGNAMQGVTVSITGTNDTPDITGGITTGLVYEDGGARTATGVLSATDVDNGAIVSWTTLGAPLYGFASINPNTGQWTYTLDNTRFETQQLFQGQTVTDTFTVRATDQFGTFDGQSEQVVSVTVVGTNDRPNLPPTPVLLSAFEDSTSFAQTSAFDLDGSPLHWSLNRGSALGYFSDYEFRADSFSIQKNFAPLFFDDFTAGGPPPNGSAGTSYSTTGLFQEVDGKLVFSGANAAAFRGTGNDSLIVGNEAMLNTNIDPANTTAGLKRNHQFVVEGVFDLVEPDVVRQQYGIQLTDGFGQLADDLTSLVVRREANGLFVRLTTNDSVFDTSSLISSAQLLPSGADQIRLRYSHDANAGHVTASYDLLDGGIVIGGGTLGPVGLFGTDTAFPGDDNNWIRAGLFANALDTNEFVQTLNGDYGTLTVVPVAPPPGFPPPPAVTPSFAELSYTPGAGAQALAQGESVVDSFFVRTVDQFGMSSAQQVNVTVHGVNDAPEVAGTATGGVTEDGLASASGQLIATDVDHFAVLNWLVLGGDFGYGSLTVDHTGQWTYTLDNTDPDLDALDQGEAASDTFIVRVTDEHFAFADQLVTITVNGADEGGASNSAPLAAPDNNDGDLVVEAGISNFGLPFAGDPTATGNVLANDVDPDLGDVLQVVAVNGLALPAGGSLTLTLTYGSLHVGANGIWTYTLNNDDPDTNALKQMMPVFAEPGFENVTYTVADADGATDTETLSIRVNGSDDMPVAVPDFNALTESDTPVTVTGNVLANDFDPEGDPLTVFGFTIPGTYGSLTLSANGDYSYTVTPSLVNFLAAGEVVHDIFDQRYALSASSGFGPGGQNFNTLLDIAITGVDEPPSFADGAVFEDGGRKTSGEVETTSVDLTATPVWTVAGAGPNTQVADYRYLIDHLTITRDGAAFFTDDFGNGVPPPASPTNPTTGYFTTGSFQESGGRVIMDGSFAGAAGAGFVGHFATLNTDISASTTQGLKRNHAFTVEARFELVLPTEALQTYGVRLSDAGTPGGGDDIAEVSLRRLSDDTFAILLRETSVVGGQPVTLASIPFTRLPGDQQIVFTLDHAADSDVVTGSFRVLNGGAVSQSGQFLDAGGQPITANIFAGGQTFTRPQIVGLSPSHAQNGVYGTLSVDADGDWTYSLNNGIQNVQALAQDERVTDTFTVQVTDAHGASETHTVAVDVFGTNDNPTPSPALLFPFFGGGVNGAYVVEDGTPGTARGNTFVGDLDHGPRAHFSVTANAVPGPLTPYSSDYLFRIDELRIIKDGAVNTLDTFSDGFAPGAPNGGDYIVSGTLTEAGGRAILDGERTVALSGTATSDLVVGNVVLVNSNQRAEDPQRGFKTGHNFTAEARFDFDADFLPAPGQTFGISFTDRANGEIPPNQLGDDNIYLLVLRDETGNVVAQFSERDTVNDTVSVIGSMTLDPVPLGSQIVLRLEHDTDDLGRLAASFDVLDSGGNLLQTGAFAEALHGEDRIFGLETPDDPADDEGWTRFQLIATGRDTNDASVDGQYGTLSIAEDGDWTYTLNPAAAQGLARGQIATDSFNIRAVDAEGASNSRPLNISVIGTGDGVEFPVNAVGTPGSDVLVGSSLADLITGSGGSDLLIGLGGSDTYHYNSINDGGGAGDTITDFMPGVGGDVLDIRDVLQGYVPDPAIFPFNFVQISSGVGPSGVTTQVSVNADGIGFDYVPLVTLNGVAGLFLSDFMNNGNIILA